MFYIPRNHKGSLVSLRDTGGVVAIRNILWGNGFFADAQNDREFGRCFVLRCHCETPEVSWQSQRVFLEIPTPASQARNDRGFTGVRCSNPSTAYAVPLPLHKGGFGGAVCGPMWASAPTWGLGFGGARPRVGAGLIGSITGRHPGRPCHGLRRWTRRRSASEHRQS